MIKFIDDPAYYKKSEYFLTNSHIYTDLSLDPLWSLDPLDPHRAQAFTTSSMASNCASKVAGNRKGRRSKPPDFLREKPNVRVWICCKNSWKGKHHGIQTSWDQGACCWLHEQGREVLKSAQPHDLLFPGMSIGAGNHYLAHIYKFMYQTMMIWKNSGKPTHDHVPHLEPGQVSGLYILRYFSVASVSHVSNGSHLIHLLSCGRLSSGE